MYGLNDQSNRSLIFLDFFDDSQTNDKTTMNFLFSDEIKIKNLDLFYFQATLLQRTVDKTSQFFFVFFFWFDF